MELSTLLLIGIINTIVVTLLTLSGGIGLVMRPILIFLGVPAQTTIATSRVSAIPGSVISQSILHKKRKIDWKLVRLLLVPNVLGGLIGVYVVTNLSEDLLKQVIGIALIIGGAALLNPKRGIEASKPLLKKFHWLFSVPFIFIIGILLVLIGGMGQLSRLLYIYGYGKTHIEAAATQKAINLWQTIITSFLFIGLGLIDWMLLLVLTISSALGNYAGTKITLSKGERYLKILVVIITFVSAIRLIFF